MALTNDGRMLATSSQEGTLIRVRKTSDGQLLGEFRRGANSCIMYQIIFDIKSRWIACTSDKSTIHVFTISKQILEALGTADFDGAHGTSDQAVETKKKYGFFGSVFKSLN